MSDSEFEDEYYMPPGTGESDGSITAVPTIKYYQKKYAHSLSDNDQKAVRLFKEYESLEKIRRFQTELTWVANSQVYSSTLHNTIGKKRGGKYGGYDEWGKLMLQWLAQAKR